MFNFFRKKEPLTTLSSISNIGGLIKEGGDYLSDELILLDDKLTANLYCSDKIIIESSGHLSGNICGNICTISGTVTGNISSTELLEIKKTAVVKGKVKAASISIEPGAVINGAVTVGEEKAMVVSLYQKIHKHTEEEYLSARWTYEQAQGMAVALAAGDTPENTAESAKKPIEHPKPTPIVVEQPKPAPVVIEEKPIKVEVVEIPTPVIAEEPQPPVIAKEEVKPEPAKKEQKSTPPKEENIQRWW